MKWTDENGVSIEGTVEEYKAYKEMCALDKKQPETTKTEPQQKLFRKWNVWTREELKLLREHYLEYAKGLISAEELIRKYFPNRTMEQIRGASRYHLKLNLYRAKEQPSETIFRTIIPKRKHKRINPDSKNIERMRFIGKRASYYMKAYQWNREKACYQASMDWNNNKKSVGSVAEVLSPEKKPLYKLYALHIREKEIKLVNVFSIMEDAQKSKAEAEALQEVGVLYYIEQEV